MRIAFYKGRRRLFNRFVSWWTTGPYSHAEAILDGQGGLAGPVLCGSSSFMDGGVRLKRILLDPEHWDIIDVPSIDDMKALKWFNQHIGDPYDVVGLLSTSFPIKHGGRRWFCNEAIGAAGDIREAWRFNPNSFAVFVERLPASRWIRGGPPREQEKQTTDPASAGFPF